MVNIFKMNSIYFLFFLQIGNVNQKVDPRDNRKLTTLGGSLFECPVVVHPLETDKGSFQTPSYLFILQNLHYIDSATMQ